MRLLKSSSGSAETFSQPVSSARSTLIWSAAVARRMSGELSILAGDLLNVCRNSNQPASAAKPPEELVLACSNLGSPYYTVDFAERADGAWIVVETGDGQVSGLAAAQDPVIYYQVLVDALERRD